MSNWPQDWVKKREFVVLTFLDHLRMSYMLPIFGYTALLLGSWPSFLLPLNPIQFHKSSFMYYWDAVLHTKIRSFCQQLSNHNDKNFLAVKVSAAYDVSPNFLLIYLGSTKTHFYLANLLTAEAYKISRICLHSNNAMLPYARECAKFLWTEVCTLLDIIQWK